MTLKAEACIHNGEGRRFRIQKAAIWQVPSECAGERKSVNRKPLVFICSTQEKEHNTGAYARTRLRVTFACTMDA